MKKDDIPAFAATITDSDSCGSIKYPGMTLRDYFAAHALPACIANLTCECPNLSISSNQTMQYAADIAYAYADAMLAERAK